MRGGLPVPGRVAEVLLGVATAEPDAPFVTGRRAIVSQGGTQERLPASLSCLAPELSCPFPIEERQGLDVRAAVRLVPAGA